jgi:hypothetical protein
MENAQTIASKLERENSELLQKVSSKSQSQQKSVHLEGEVSEAKSVISSLRGSIQSLEEENIFLRSKIE